MKTAIFLIALFCLVVPVRAQEIQPGTRPDKTQRELLKRGYGMFIHYGMNTFLDKDWSEGVEPAKTNAGTGYAARSENFASAASVPDAYH